MGYLTEAQKRSINKRAKVVSVEIGNLNRHITQLLEVLPAHHAKAIAMLPLMLQGVADHIVLTAEVAILLDEENAANAREIRQ